MNWNKTYKTIVDWRVKHVNGQRYIMLLSMVVGLLVGLAAVTIKNLVHLIQENVTHFLHSHSSLYLIVLPLFGVFFTILFIKYINRRPVGHGIPGVLFAISRSKGKIEKHNLFSSIFSSALTVGFGGSVGLEGPTVATGAAIGSNIGGILKLNYKQITLLLGCACAGAMASIFKAPIAAIVFALEVIMLDLTMSAIVPLLLSSATAALTSYLFLGQNFLYSFEIKEAFVLDQVPFYIGLGILTGIVSAYFTKTYQLLSNIFFTIKRQATRFLIGGIVLGLLVFLLPSLYGEGYEAINKCLSGDWSYLFENSFFNLNEKSPVILMTMVVLVILFKAIAVPITFAAGGVGGVFAPSLFIGANTGMLYALFFNYLGVELEVSNFVLIGMAGLISGFIHAPLTSIFLLAELTGGYELFMPLMIASTLSYATAKIFFKNSVYTYQLAKRGELVTHHKDKKVLMMLNIKELIESDFNIIHPDQTMGDLVNVITKAKRNIFPVVERDGTFRGIVKMDDIRHIMFNSEMYDSIHVRDLMFMPSSVIDPMDPVEEIALKFQDSGRYNIAVIEHGKYLGFISRARLFSAYRRWLKEFSED
jgi:CIC family chloride channel protein